jgi:hypothetical protein
LTWLTSPPSICLSLLHLSSLPRSMAARGCHRIPCSHVATKRFLDAAPVSRLRRTWCPSGPHTGWVGVAENRRCHTRYGFRQSSSCFVMKAKNPSNPWIQRPSSPRSAPIDKGGPRQCPRVKDFGPGEEVHMINSKVSRQTRWIKLWLYYRDKPTVTS